MTQNQDQKAVLFVDIADSTVFYDTLGDRDAQTLMADAMSMLSDIVTQYSGDVIKTIGDAVMATFDSAEVAGQAAIFMQQIYQTNQVSDLAEVGQLKIRIGINFGDVVIDHDDVFGNAVILASRVSAEAKPQQILTTKETRDLMPENLVDASRFIIKKPLKGLPGEHEIYEILDADDDANVTTIDIEDAADSLSKDLNLVLIYHEQKWVLDKDRSSLTIGRSEDNDIIVSHDKASRQHAKVELKAGKYVLTDKSANGTYLYQEDGEGLKIHMDHVTLYQKGHILIGDREEKQDAISFSHET